MWKNKNIHILKIIKWYYNLYKSGDYGIGPNPQSYPLSPLSNAKYLIIYKIKKINKLWA